MLIEEVKFRFGAGRGADALVLDEPAVTIFVGPNNSGKSMVLREIAELSSQGYARSTIIDGLRFRKFTIEEIDAILEAWTDHSRNPGEMDHPDHAYRKFGPWRTLVHVPEFRRTLQNPDVHISGFAKTTRLVTCLFSMVQAGLV